MPKKKRRVTTTPESAPNKPDIPADFEPSRELAVGNYPLAEAAIHAGKVVKQVFDGKQRAQALDWALPDIFAPFKAEWDRGFEFGSFTPTPPLPPGT